MLAVNLVTWPPYPEAQPCDVVGGVLLRVLWVQEGVRIHSTLSGEGFQCCGVQLSLQGIAFMDIYSLPSRV